MSIAHKVNGIKGLWRFDNRWQLILSRLLFPNEKLSYYRYNGVEVVIDQSVGERHVVSEVLTSPMYRETFAGMDLPRNPKVLDVGANIGCFPLLLAADGYEPEFVCIELNPKTFSRLRFNIERNFSGGYELVNAAVCGSRRTIDVSLGGGDASDSIYRNDPEGTKWSLPGYTFNEIYAEHFGEQDIDLCKIDIEGAEFEIFTNSGCDSIKKCRNILIEIHQKTGNSREIVRDQLKEFGFTEVDGESKNGPDDLVHFFKR